MMSCTVFYHCATHQGNQIARVCDTVVKNCATHHYDEEGFGQGFVLASALRLDQPLRLGIGGIGCDMVSEGASAHGDC